MQLTRSRWRSIVAPTSLGAWLVTLVVAFLVAVPVLSILQSAFLVGAPARPGAFTLRHFTDFLTGAVYHRATTNTLTITAIAVLVAVPVGFLLAWIVVRSDVPWKPLMSVGNLVPYLFPTFLGAIGWAFLAAPRTGLLNVLLSGPFPPSGPFNAYSLESVGIVLGIYLTPIVYLVCAGVLSNMDGSLEDAARVTGSNEFATLRRVTFPLMLPGVVGGGILVTAMALENFGVPVVLGLPARIPVLMTQIYVDQVYNTPRFGPSGVIALSLLVVTSLLTYAYLRITASSHKYAVIGGKATRPKLVRLGRWRYPALGAWLLYFACAVVLPYGSLLFLSLRPYASFGDQLTLANFAAMGQTPSISRSIWNSIGWSFVGATVGMAMATAVALIALKSRLRIRRVLDVLATVPVAIPGVVLGTGLLWFWVAKPVPIYGTFGIILIVFVTKYLPLGQRSVSAALLQVSKELEQMSAVCGARPLRTFAGVTAPLVRDGIAAGWVLLWLSMFREMGAVIMVYAFGIELLPIMVLQAWDSGRLTVAAALATVEAVIALVALLVFVAISRRTGRPALL